jgi:hypothetical protein
MAISDLEILKSRQLPAERYKNGVCVGGKYQTFFSFQKGRLS